MNKIKKHIEHYPNGQKKEEQIYKDGELTSGKNWDEDGNENDCN